MPCVNRNLWQCARVRRRSLSGMSDHITVSGLSSAVLARRGVPAGVAGDRWHCPGWRLVVTAQCAPVYVQPDDTARVVGSFAIGTAVRTTGPDTAEWVRVSSVVPDVSGWVRWADIVELRH